MSEDRKRLTSGFSQTMTSVLALAVALGAVTPAYAAITNTGEVTASTPRGTDVSDTSDESVTVETPTPEFKIVKSISSISVASGDDSTNPDGGDVIVFNYAVTNTGNVTIDASTLSITDPGPTFDGNTLAGTWTGALTYVSGDTVTADSEINPNETWVYSASYTLTQTDVDRAAGITDGVTNTVTGATADSLGGDTATFDSGGSTLTAEDTIPENGAVSLTKIATRDGTNVDDGSTTPYAEGEDIVYLFTVENTGNVTLSSLTVSETAFVAPSGASAPTIDCGGGLNTIASLAPGATASCTATYTVQATDL